MNRGAHQGGALVVFVILGVIFHYVNILSFTENFSIYSTGFILLLLGTALPDIIEPAGHYTHRKFFHSKRVLKYLAYALGVTFIISLFIKGVFGLFFFLLAYIIHLLMDSTTKMGLPN